MNGNEKKRQNLWIKNAKQKIVLMMTTNLNERKSEKKKKKYFENKFYSTSLN